VTWAVYWGNKKLMFYTPRVL